MNYKKIITRIIVPLRYQWYRKIREWQHQSLENSLETQKNFLFEILQYAVENVPYYQKIFQKIKIPLNRDSVIQVLESFPILTKEILRKEFENLKAKNFKGKYIENTSGGSTGEPVIFLQDKTFNEIGAGVKFLYEEWAGGGPGEKLVKLWGSEKDILEGTIGLRAKISNFLFSRVLLNAFRMTEEDMFKFVEVINKFKPKVIEAYVQSIHELAKFIEKNNLRVYSPKGIITSAGVLGLEVKKYLEDIFKTRVFNRYGSREAGDIACSCEKTEELHINVFTHYLEILNDNLKKCEPGEIGKIYITTLHNKVMPFIRYEIGDLGVISEKTTCECGRGMPLMKKVVGRTVNVFLTKDNTLIDGEYFTHLFYFKKWVRKFQVIQKDFDLIHIKIVGEKNEKDIEKINENIKMVMGKDCKIDWFFVDEIFPTPSGKFLYTISEINKN